MGLRKRIIAAIGTRSSRKGGKAAVSMGISMAALVGVLEQAMSSSSTVALMLLCCLAGQLQRRQRLHRLQHLQRHPHLLQVAASGQPAAAEAVQVGGTARTSPVAVVAVGTGAPQHY